MTRASIAWQVTFALLLFGPAVVSRGLAQSGTRNPYVPPQPRELPATLVVLLPADASLDIQGVRMSQAGDRRRFTSPPLAVGRQYTYTLKAQWQDNGQPVVRERAVPVRAGEEVVVDLRTAPKDESPSKK